MTFKGFRSEQSKWKKYGIEEIEQIPNKKFLIGHGARVLVPFPLPVNHVMEPHCYCRGQYHKIYKYVTTHIDMTFRHGPLGIQFVKQFRQKTFTWMWV